jgi:hypothetical protein
MHAPTMRTGRGARDVEGPPRRRAFSCGPPRYAPRRTAGGRRRALFSDGLFQTALATAPPRRRRALAQLHTRRAGTRVNGPMRRARLIASSLPLAAHPRVRSGREDDTPRRRAFRSRSQRSSRRTGRAACAAGRSATSVDRQMQTAGSLAPTRPPMGCIDPGAADSTMTQRISIEHGRAAASIAATRRSSCSPRWYVQSLRHVQSNRARGDLGDPYSSSTPCRRNNGIACADRQRRRAIRRSSRYCARSDGTADMPSAYDRTAYAHSGRTIRRRSSMDSIRRPRGRSARPCLHCRPIQGAERLARRLNGSLPSNARRSARSAIEKTVNVTVAMNRRGVPGSACVMASVHRRAAAPRAGSRRRGDRAASSVRP